MAIMSLAQATAVGISGRARKFVFLSYGKPVFVHRAFIAGKAAFVENGIRRPARIGDPNVLIIDEMRGAEIYPLPPADSVHGVENHRAERIRSHDRNRKRHELADNLLVVRGGTENQAVAAEFGNQPHRFQLLLLLLVGIEENCGKSLIVRQTLYRCVNTRIIRVPNIGNNHHNLHGAL